MIKRKRKNRILVSWLVLMLLLSCFSGFAISAAEQTGSLTLNKAEPGTEFRLYRIEKRNTDGTYSAESAFEKTNIKLTQDSKVDLRAIATTLSNYITSATGSSVPQPIDTQKAGENGSAKFSDLIPGMYLVLADTLTKADGKSYSYAPVLTFLPAEESDGSELYDQTADVKPDNAEGSTSHSVKKVWSGVSEDSVPKSVVVELLKNGKSTGQRVTLSKDNDWKHTWENLEKAVYSVKEISVLSGYEVSVSDNNGLSTVRNTKTNPKTPSGGGGGNGGGGGGGSKIPQTGQLWWPVTILAGLGLVFLLIGMFIRRRSSRN